MIRLRPALLRHAPRLVGAAFFCLACTTALPQAQEGGTGGAEVKVAGDTQSSIGALSSETTGVTVHGTVLNSVTGQPIARALVSLDSNNFSTLTDNEGRFTFEAVPAGASEISCRRPGYGEVGGDGASRLTAIQVGAGMGELTLELAPLASITGQVLLSGEDPPEDLRVQLLQKHVRDGRGQWSNLRSAQVSSDGRFRFGNLQPGAYLVHVAVSLDPIPAPGLTPDNLLDKPRTGYVAVYAPGVADIAAAQVLTLAAGQQGETRVRVNRETFFPVTARVAGAPDNGRMTFSVAGGSLLGLPARYTRDDGLVHVLLPTGHYSLLGHSLGPSELSGQLDLDVRGAPVSGLTIALAPVSTVPVVIRRDFTASQGVQSVNPGVQVTLVREDSLSNGSVNVMHHVPAPDVDAYELTGVQPGQYWANAITYSGYIAAMSSGGTDLLRAPLAVNASGGADPIEVTLRNDYGSFSASLGGSLLGGETGSAAVAIGVIPKVYVHMEPTSSTGVERIELVPSGGQLQLTSVVPGDYLVFASAGRAPVEYRNPVVMASLVGAGQTVTVPAGGVASATLQKLVVIP
jgi:hypothetical protein